MTYNVMGYYFSAFSNEYVKAPAAIIKEDMNKPTIASKFVHPLAKFPFH
jgi:hypothetical protein